MAITTEKQQAEIDFSGVQGREVLSADKTWYVDPAGSDTNDGLTALTPFATLQKACDEAGSVDARWNRLTIFLAPGTYNESNIRIRTVLAPAERVPGSVALDIKGNGGKAIINSTGHCLIIEDFNGWVFLTEFEFQSTSDSVVIGRNTNAVHFNACEWSAVGASNYCIRLNDGAHLIQDGSQSLEISDSALGGFVLATKGSYAELDNTQIVFTGTPAFAGTFLGAIQGSYIKTSGMSFVGTFTGSRFSASNFSHIESGNNSLTFYPGTVAGTLDATSCYEDRVVFDPTSGVPAGAGLVGEHKYDATTDTLYIYDGTTWQPH